MKKILLTAFLAPLSLFSSLDETKLIQHLQSEIDGRSNEITHSDQKETFVRAWHVGYMTAYCKLLHEIESGLFEVKD